MNASGFNMKNVGMVVLTCGILWIFAAFNMDTTVETESLSIGNHYMPSKRVHNIGLMDERRNHLIFSGLLILVGVILFVAGRRQQHQFVQLMPGIESTIPNEDTKKCPYCAETIRIEAIKCRFCGESFDPNEVAKQVATLKSNTSFENRVLCSDGNCIGVIGPDGRCKVCGAYSDDLGR
jgi:hypothetical protein